MAPQTVPMTSQQMMKDSKLFSTILKQYLLQKILTVDTEMRNYGNQSIIDTIIVNFLNLVHQISQNTPAIT